MRHRPLLGRSLRVALVVGTVLTVINQGDLLLHWPWNAALLWKVPLTFIVSFCVATWGALRSCAVPPSRTEREGGYSEPHDV